MKIAIVANCASRGGAERVAVLLTNYLCNKGYDVTYVAVLLDEIEYDLSSEAKYIFCGDVKGGVIRRSLSRYWKLYMTLCEEKCDVVVSFMTLENLFLPLKKNLYKIYSMRSDPQRTFNRGLKKVIRDFVYSSADVIVFQTAGTRAYFSKTIREKGIIVGNPIKVDLPYWREDNESKVIIAAGRLTEAKDFPMLIDGFSRFHVEKPDYKLVIYGEGELRQKLQGLIDSKGLSECILLAGNVKNIHEKMSEAQIYVSSSSYEGISNSMIEALAIGVPSICTDVSSGGAREYIQDGQNGYLIEVGNSEQLCDKMLKLTNDSELRNGFSKESRKIRQLLEEDKIFREWEKIITEKHSFK